MFGHRRKSAQILCVVMLCAWCGLFGASGGPLTRFEELMGGPPKEALNRQDEAKLQQLSRNFCQTIDFSRIPSDRAIPEVIHVLWLGPKAFPAASLENVLSWMKWHPGGTFMFWTDSQERQLPVEGMKRRLISELDLGRLTHIFQESTNWGEKADILRYAILKKEGGAYVDHDVFCVRSCQQLFSGYDFVVGLAGICHHEAMDSSVVIGNSVIFSRAEHPILTAALKLVEDRWDDMGRKYGGTDAASVLKRVIARTADSFSMAVKDRASVDGNRDLVLPTSYFYLAELSLSPDVLARLRNSDHVLAIHECSGQWK